MVPVGRCVWPEFCAGAPRSGSTRFVLFYARRSSAAVRPKKPTPAPAPHADLLDGLKALGLVVTAADVGAAVKELFPQGTRGIDPGEVIRSVFLHCKGPANHVMTGSNESLAPGCRITSAIE